MATKSPRNDNASRNRKVAKFGLAGIAIIGVGAGLTSAAWTDDVWFTADAASGTIELQGRVLAVETDPSYTPGSFQDADTEGLSIVIPADAFGGLTPNDDLSVTLELYNDGDGILALQPAVVEVVGDLFDDPGVTWDISAYSAPSIAPAASATVTFSIQTPDWDGIEGQGLTGDVVINVQAST